jgi:hypothetical protein
MHAQHPYFRVTSEYFAGHGRNWRKKASQTYVIGGLAGFEVTVGTVRPMQAGDKLLGIFAQAIGSADTGYADTSPIAVNVLFGGAEVDCPISSGSAALTELGDELDVVNGGLSLTTTESNKDFVSVETTGSLTTRILAVPGLTRVY